LDTPVDTESEARGPKLFLSPTREVLLVFGVSMLSLPLIVSLSTLGYLGLVESHLYIYGTAIEFLFVGFLPLFLSLHDHDKRGFYGLGLDGATRSIALGISLVAIRAVLRFATGAMPFQVGLAAFSQSLAQPFPQNLFLAVVTTFVYGPLEVFFITFMVAKLDLGFGSGRGKVITRGMVLGVLLWALIHLSNGVFYGLANSVAQVVSNFIYGILLMAVFKYSKCSLGTILSFTITNLVQ
jgi:hypothetical protein